MSESNSQGRQGVCAFTCEEPLCKTLDRAGVPSVEKWRTLIFYMRGIESYDFLSEQQKAGIQRLVISTLQERDYSERKYQEVMRRLHEILNAPCSEKLHNALSETAAMIVEFRKMLRLRGGDVEKLGMQTMGTLQQGGDPELIVENLKASFREIVDTMRRDADNLDQLSRTDALTNLNNRRALDEELASCIQRWQTQGTPLSMLLADIDHFKQFNDSYGHRIGDQALATVAKIIRRVEEKVRGEGQEFSPARYGGEEFVILLPGAGEELALEVAEDLRQQVERYNFIIRDTDGEVLKRDIHITISIGVAEMDKRWRGAFAENLLDAADKALYRAKAQGRNRVLGASSG